MSRELPLEEPGDPMLSYALMPYEPPADPAGKLRSAGLLLHSFDQCGVGSGGDELLAATAQEFGRNGTAWGIKQQGDRVAWELYYYYHRDHRPLTYERMGRVTAAAPGGSGPMPDSDRSWYSLSFDVTADVLEGAPVDGFHAYTTHSPATPRTALSYAVQPTGATLENVYYLFHPVADRPVIESYLASSMGAVDTARSDDLLWPELLGGDHIALAHKPAAEGIYFGGVEVDALAHFLRRVGFASWLTDFVDAERDRLDHLRFDVGFDYLIGARGVEIVKAGLYGVI